jgi:tetratricopeptide (TPR) repeat protein
MFRHDLTRDAAYNSILKRKRAKFHLRVGEAIEEIFPERLEEEAHLLAYHYREAKEDEKALNYYTMAGNAARRVSAYTEAIDHYSHALEIANRIEASPAQLSFLYTRRGRIYELAGQFREALGNYRELEKLGRERSEPALEMPALNSLATIHAIPSANWNPKKADAFAERALALAEELDDPRGIAKALWNLMLVENYAERDHQAAIDYGERSLAIASEHHLEEETAFALHDLSRAYSQAGQLDKAGELQEQSRALWEQMGNSEMLADNLTGSSFNAALRGDLDQGVEFAERALEMSRENGNFWGQGYSLMGLGLMHTELGNVKAAFDSYEEGAGLAERADFTGAGVFVHAIMSWQLTNFGALDQASAVIDRTRPTRVEEDPTLAFILGAEALIMAHRGDPEGAADLAQKARSSVNTDSLNPEFLGYATLLLAEMLLIEQKYQEALDNVNHSLEIFMGAGVRLFTPQLLLRSARALRGLDRLGEAAETLEQARTDVESMGMQLTRMWVLIEMVDLARDHEPLQAPLSEAQESIRFISEHMGDDELREIFLSQPQIRSIIEQ